MKVTLDNRNETPVCLFEKGECFERDGRVYMAAETLYRPIKRLFVDLESGVVYEYQEFMGKTGTWLDMKAIERSCIEGKYEIGEK